VVSTPTSRLVKTSFLCARCPIEVILGMDLLAANCILIDCQEKRLLFPNSKELELLSSQGVMKEIRDGT